MEMPATTSIMHDLRNSAIWRAVLLPYLTTRIIVLGILLLTPFIAFLLPQADGSRSMTFSHQTPWRAAIANSLLPGDAFHYLHIAQNGYATPLSFGWFPLFPIAWRLSASVTREYVFTGCTLSNGLFLMALLVLHRVVMLFGYSEYVAARAVLYLTIFPTTHFFSVPLSEALFLLLTAGSFYAALRNRFAVAGILGAMAAATRLAGILLLPSLLILLWLGKAPKNRGRAAAAMFLIPCGPLAFFIYTYLKAGDFFAYQHAQMSFSVQPEVFFLAPLIHYAFHPSIFHGWSFFPLQVGMALLGFLACWVLARQRQWVLAMYLLGSIILPLSAGLFGSMTRFLMVSFPFVIVLAKAGENPLIDQTIRTVFVALMALLTLACAAKFGLGMA